MAQTHMAMVYLHIGLIAALIGYGALVCVEYGPESCMSMAIQDGVAVGRVYLSFLSRVVYILISLSIYELNILSCNPPLPI